MSVLLTQAYNHFSQSKTTNLKDEFFSSVGNFALPFLGEDSIFELVKVDKVESRHYEDEEFEDQPRKKLRTEIPWIEDDPFEEEKGPPLMFDWNARSSNEGQLVTGDGQTGLEVTRVMVAAKVQYGEQSLLVRAEFSENMYGLVTTMIIEGTSVAGFLMGWGQELWQPQLENLAITSPVLVCSSANTCLLYEGVYFPLATGLNAILRALPADNLKRLIVPEKTLYLFGVVLDQDNEWAPLQLKSYPFFELALGRAIKLQGCFFEISTKVPDPPSDGDEQENLPDQVSQQPIPFAQLNLGGKLHGRKNYLSLWTDVPADNEVLAFRLATSHYPPAWTLDELAPLLADNTTVQETFISMLAPFAGVHVKVSGLEYYYDLGSQALYSLSLHLTMLNRGAWLSPGGVRIDFENLDVHCNVGSPDDSHALSLWAEGIGRISGTTMPLSIDWEPVPQLVAEGEGQPAPDLFQALGMHMPELDLNMTGIADYQIEFPSDGQPRLSMQPLYASTSLADDADDDTPEGPIVLTRQGVVSWPALLVPHSPSSGRFD